MSERKTEVIDLRMSPRVKELLRLAAAHERRTLSNMLEVLVLDFSRDRHLDVPETSNSSRRDARSNTVLTNNSLLNKRKDQDDRSNSSGSTSQQGEPTDIAIFTRTLK